MGDLERVKAAALNLAGVKPAELPDVRLPDERRRKLKLMARVMAEEHTVDELMFLAGALEQRANLKRRSHRG